MSGQNPTHFTDTSALGLANPNGFPENTQPGTVDYDSQYYKQLIKASATPGSANGDANDIIMQEKTIDNLLGFVKGVILCGGDGWCGSRCCSNNLGPKGLNYRPNGLRRKPKHNCYPVCQPACTAKCIEAAKILMQTKVTNSLKLSGDVEPSEGVTAVGGKYESDGKSLVATIPLCRPACMPACKESCLKKKQRPMKVTCRPACMPECTPNCVASPPLMVPCMSGSDKDCSCAPGYVQCSKFTCCMRYRTMAVRYRKLLPGYLYSDNNTESGMNGTATSTNTTKTEPKSGFFPDVHLNETLQSAGNFFSSFSSIWKPNFSSQDAANHTISVPHDSFDKAPISESKTSKLSTFKKASNADYEVLYDYDENIDAGKAYETVTTVP
uniref:Uncharacterized protein n=1 Tax=Panagrellus redivivus TaxID=6233 RepID=A0A7E4UMA5_PANRE